MSTIGIVLAVVPLLILPGVLFHFDVTPKVVTLLLGAAGVVTFFRPIRALDVLLAAQAVSLVISTALSTDPALSFAGSNWRRLGLPAHIALLLLTYAISRAPVRTALRAIAASGGLAAAYGISQYFGWDPLLPRDTYRVGEGVWAIVRPPGTLGHAGYFVVFLLHAASAGLAVAASDEHRKWRRAGALAAALATAAVLLNGSRAGLLGLAAGLAVLALTRRPQLKKRHVALGAAAVIAVVLFYLSPSGLQLRARTRWFREDPGGGGRIALWTDTLRMALDRPLFGYGPETYGTQFSLYQSEGLAKQFPDRYWESPHNIFLDALAAQGLPGLALLLGLTALGLWRLRQSPPLLAGLAAALVANQFVAFTIPTALVFYTTVAIGSNTPVTERRRWVLLPVGALLAGVAVSLAWTDYWLDRARTALTEGRIEQGSAYYERSRRLALPGVDTDLWYSRALYAALAGHPEAMQAAERAAIRSEQRANAWYNLAAFHAVRNDVAWTEQSLRTAMEWAPTWYKPRWMLAQVLEQTGFAAEAEVQARRAMELNNGRDPEVRQTWEAIRARRQQK